MAKQDPTSAFLKAIRGDVPPPRRKRRVSRVSLEVDADIMAYFEDGERDAQARIHRVLRAHVDRKTLER